MQNVKRSIRPIIEDFLADKMVFLGGPRQVGKTTLCLSFLQPGHRTNPLYLNWDDLTSKAILKSGQLPAAPLLVIDEIHKFKNWRTLMKGYYDKRQDEQRFLVTGSARLDHYRRGGDSLMGRYRYLRLHPFSLRELALAGSSVDVSDLLKYGGFPEPLFSQSERKHKLWQRERLHRIVLDDIRDLENLREFSQIELLAEELPRRVGSLLSVKSLSEDLQVSPHTVSHWLEILDKVYYSYRIPPYGAPRIRALKKAQKLFLWDWSSVEDQGSRFENFVAGQLLKYCHFLEDTEGEKMELRFLKDTDDREIDFVVLKNRKPMFAVECKTGEASLSKSINYFRERTAIPYFYQVHMGKKDYISQKSCRVLPFATFCRELKMP